MSRTRCGGSRAAGEAMWVAHRSLKILGACACLIIFASSVWSMSHWSEARGVWDDLCYLRQAHLFQRFGLRGIDTNLALDDDDYMSTKLKEIGYPAWRGAPCHTLMPATNKRVLQYPPGTGFVLAIFPAGFQVVPLNILATSIILLCVLAAIHLANTGWRIGAASAFGCAAIYFMINPAKASYSMAPTMVVCALAGLLTVFHFRASSSGSRLLTVSLLGLLVGISVNFRVANLFLSAGYFAFFLVAFFQSRKLDAFLDGMLFGRLSSPESLRHYGRMPSMRGPAVDDLRRVGCGADGLDFQRLAAIHEGSAGHSADLGGHLDGCRLLDKPRGSRPVGCACCGWKSSGRPDLFHDPPALRALLHHSAGDAFVLESAVQLCDAGRAGFTGQVGTMISSSIRIAVLVPCFNEEAAVATVISDFRKVLPDAAIYIYDNNSSDRTAAVAREAGAQVRNERHQGKGHVVRRMFADVDADIYLLVDGDATYDASSAPRMIAALIEDRLDMVVGLRVEQAESAYRPGHRFGNRMLTGFLSMVFGHAFRDVLSGYRVFSRRFVKSFPALSDGFEIETELSVHALELALPVAEIETPYYPRPEGSFSKLNTWRDGFRILGTILKLYRSEKPLNFFTAIACSSCWFRSVWRYPLSSPISNRAWFRACLRRFWRWA